jgi:hypothetical protein
VLGWASPVVRALTWKDLRDTDASIYVGKGVPMAVVPKELRRADPHITSERYAYPEQDYLTAEMRKLSLLSRIEPPSTQVSEGANGAANCDSENSMIPLTSTERRTGFEPATPSLGSWPRSQTDPRGLGSG